MRYTAARLDLVRRLRAEPAKPVLRVRQRRGELRAGDGGGRGGILRHARAVRARSGRSRLAAPRHGEGARPLLPYGGRRDGPVPGRVLADVRADAAGVGRGQWVQAQPGDQLRDVHLGRGDDGASVDRKSTRLNSSHITISYAVFCLKKKKTFSTS